MTEDEVRKCKCDRVLEDDDKKNCKVCKLEKRLIDERRQRDSIASEHNSQTFTLQRAEKKIKDLEYKNKFPCWIYIEQRTWNLTKDRLTEVMTLLAPLSDLVTFRTGRNE